MNIKTRNLFFEFDNIKYIGMGSNGITFWYYDQLVQEPFVFKIGVVSNEQIQVMHQMARCGIGIPILAILNKSILADFWLHMEVSNRGNTRPNCANFAHLFSYLRTMGNVRSLRTVIMPMAYPLLPDQYSEANHLASRIKEEFPKVTDVKAEHFLSFNGRVVFIDPSLKPRNATELSRQRGVGATMEVVEAHYKGFSSLVWHSSLWCSIFDLRRFKRKIVELGKVDEVEEKRIFEWFQRISNINGASFATMKEFRAFYMKLNF